MDFLLFQADQQQAQQQADASRGHEVTAPGPWDGTDGNEGRAENLLRLVRGAVRTPNWSAELHSSVVANQSTQPEDETWEELERF